MLKWDGVTDATNYIRHVICFYIGWGALWLFTLNRVKVYHSEGPSFNLFSRLPDGSPALSEFAVSVLGFVVFLAALGLAWLIRRWTLM